MYILTVANQKGGVGKSTTSFVVGSILRAQGYRVLLVDGDGQGNLGRMAKAGSGSTTLFDVLHGADIHTAIQDAPKGFILPSDERLAADRTPAADLLKRFTALFNAVSGNFDIAIVDTQPSLSPVTVAAIAASNGVLVPTKPDLFSIDGLGAFGKNITDLQKINPQLRIVGVVCTQYAKNTSVHRAVLPSLRAQAQLLHTTLYEPPVRRSIALEELQFTGDLPKTGAVDDYLNITKKLIRDIGLKKGCATNEQRR